MRKKKIFRIIYITLGICSFIWLWYSYKARGTDKNLLKSSSSVQVEYTRDFISFTPVTRYNKILIFYPGALVETKAYAPLCRKIAEKGIKSIIIKMPWRLAQYGYTKPKDLNLLNDTTKQYILTGHSKGGMMAAQFVYENPTIIDKLILLGTSGPKDIDLSVFSLPVMKISGSNDGVATIEKVNSNKSKLPQSTRYIIIKGANHSQFGYYGSQLGDNKADISREQQQQIILDHILSFIK